MTQTSTRTAVTITAKAARRQGLRVATFTVEELISFLPANGSISTFYESFGHVNGQERFARTAMRRSDRGIECLTKHVEDKGAWRVTLVYPTGQGRTVRVLTR